MSRRQTLCRVVLALIAVAAMPAGGPSPAEAANHANPPTIAVVLKNPSDVEHRLSVVSVASAVRTLAKPAVDRGEVKGGLRGPPFGYRVREIYVAPGGIAEWSFIPVREAGVDIGCKIDGHAKAGMVATIYII